MSELLRREVLLFECWVKVIGALVPRQLLVWDWSKMDTITSVRDLVGRGAITQDTYCKEIQHVTLYGRALDSQAYVDSKLLHAC